MLTSTYIPLTEETGQFIYSNYGNKHALLFRGDDAFRERTENLIGNFFYKPRQIINFDEVTRYVMMEQQEILDMVSNHFRGIISLSGECRDAEGNLDEASQISLSKERAMEWWLSKVLFNNILMHQYDDLSRVSKEVEYFGN